MSWLRRLLTPPVFEDQARTQQAFMLHVILRSDIARSADAADKMRRLLDDLLELSRIGRLVNPPEDVSMGEIAREAIGLVRGRLDQRAVSVEIAPEMPVVRGDRGA